MRTVIDLLIRQFNEIHTAKLWMGSNFEMRINILNGDNAFLRPLPHMHSAAETIAHITAWRNDALLKIRSGKGILKDTDPENWPDNDTLKKKGWSRLKSEYNVSLQELLHELMRRDDSFLDENYFDQYYQDTYSYHFLIFGLLHHDLYHLGQLGLIFKYLKLNYPEIM